ncbi:MAG: hypothetical protein WD601_04950, partial [Pseudohongiellaceae bacterium]
MSTQHVTSARDLLEQIRPPTNLQLDCSVLRKGIDNYHIDVELSASFVRHARRVIEELVRRVVVGDRLQALDMEALRDVYADMIKVSLHRTKTDLTPEQVRVLQFAIIKFVLQEVRDQLDGMVSQVEETLAQQQYAGSRSLLVTQQ